MHEISKPESDVSESMDDAEYANLTVAEKNKLSYWNDLEQKYWGKHRLRYIPDMRNKVKNSEMLAIVHFNVIICSQFSQACRKNAVFLINTKSIKDLDDVKSNLNRTFRMSIESTWKMVETEIGECLKIKVIANKRKILDKNQVYMKINRSENSHGLIRNTVYFKGKDDQVVNSKIVLQYYIDRKICGDKEHIEYIASSHGNSKSQKWFYTMKKSVLSNFKSQLFHKGKRTASILYDNSHQNGSDNRDFGDLPRSKKQLIDL